MFIRDFNIQNPSFGVGGRGTAVDLPKNALKRPGIRVPGWNQGILTHDHQSIQSIFMFFPQQGKLMGSSAQNSSSVHWCRCWVRFNEVPEKVPKVPEKVWEALVQSQVTFNRVPEKVPERLPEKVWEALVQNQVRFNRVPEKVRKKVPEVWEASVQSQVTFNRVPGAEPGQVQQGTGEGSGEGLGGFGAEPGQVQHGSGKGSGEGLGGFGGKPGQVQQDLQPFNSRKPS